MTNEIMMAAAEQPQPEAPSRWIACSERMPEDDVEVLVWHATIQERLLARWNGVEWFETWSGGVLDCDGITHWMPLPAAPGDDRALLTAAPKA